MTNGLRFPSVSIRGRPIIRPVTRYHARYFTHHRGSLDKGRSFALNLFPRNGLSGFS